MILSQPSSPRRRGVLQLWGALRSYYAGSSGRDQREFYDLESSLPYFDQVNRILCRHKRQLILSFLERGRTKQGSLSVLEVGCGVGHFARILAGRGHRVSAIDISPRKIEKARAASPPELHYRVGDVRLLGQDAEMDRWLDTGAGPGAGGKFDAIVAADVIEHVPADPRGLLASVRRRIRPGGQLVVSVPSRLWIGDPGHVWQHLPGDWARIFEESGLEIRSRAVSRLSLYRLPTPFSLAEVFDLRPR